MIASVLEPTDRRADVGPTAKELRCMRKACSTLLARLQGVTLVYADGSHLGPIAPGTVFARECPRCGARNVKWL